MTDEEQPSRAGFSSFPDVVGTWFGCGLSPLAPVTVGAAGAIPIHLVLRLLPPGPHLLAVLGITAVGFWASQRVADERDEEDPSRVVIDEVAGALIAMGLVRRRSVSTQVAAWVLFRVLDITKPGPVSRAEKLKPAGLGIMADDLLAGALAGIAVLWRR